MATDETKRPVETDETDSPKKRKADIEELEVNLEAPEPPSKRARRAEKKGKKLPPKQDSDDEKASSKKQEKEDAKTSVTRSEHSVWVGNLPWSVTTDELRKWLIEHSGEAITEESITRVNMPTQKQPGKNVKVNKGFAYVDFADMGPKVAAIALSENWLGIRKLLIKDATSFEGRPKKEERDAKDAAANGHGAKSAADVPASRKIFVGNLSFQTTEDDVRANFDKCGEIDWVKIATFEDSGKCKGYGWVKFREAESAGWAVKGFVKLKEKIETEDDFVSKPDEGGSGDDEAEAEQKKFKTRKWWVNRIAGRTLKIELAEDDQARYKKRFGKDAQRKKMQSQDDGESAPPDSNKNDDRPPPARELKAQDDLMVARLTGTAAKHTGTKITFD